MRMVVRVPKVLRHAVKDPTNSCALFRTRVGEHAARTTPAKLLTNSKRPLTLADCSISTKDNRGVKSPLPL